jgi:hypothetical protein
VPRQNRVTPLGELVADPTRGLVYGNRGCLHDSRGRIVRNYNGKRWIACRLAFRDWHREPLMQPGRFTELFFLDEATAFAAGHRPCALCRRADYVRFLELLEESGADAADARLHEDRLDPSARTRRLHDAALEELPDGAFVLSDGVPHLVLGTKLLEWTSGGYIAARPRSGEVSLITPPSLVSVLQAGWEGEVPFLHPSVEVAPPAPRNWISSRLS